MKLPEKKRQATPQAVIDGHLDALNKGEWERQVGEAFRAMTSPFKDGGLFGVRFTTEHAFVVGDTVNAMWRVEADFLKKPYRGADAYITRDGLLAAQVSTFDMLALKRHM